MAKQKTKKNSRKVTIDGTDYTCSMKNRNVTVRAHRTAKGQGLVAGVLNLDTGEWHNDSGNGSLSTKSKEIIAALYIKA